MAVCLHICIQAATHLHVNQVAIMYVDFLTWPLVFWLEVMLKLDVPSQVKFLLSVLSQDVIQAAPLYLLYRNTRTADVLFLDLDTYAANAVMASASFHSSNTSNKGNVTVLVCSP